MPDSKPTADFGQELRRLFCWPLTQQRYGLQIPGENAYPHQKTTLTTRRIAQHLAGEETVSLLLVNSDKETKLGAIDIDTPRDAADLAGALGIVVKLAIAASARGLRTLVEFSGRRGFHLLIPCQPVSAFTMRKAMEVIARDAGFQADEIFPSSALPLGRRGGEGKTLKLAGALHRISNQRSWIWPGALDSQDALRGAQDRLQRALPAIGGETPVEGPDAAPAPSEQAEWLAAFKPNSASSIEEVAGALTIPDLDFLEGHPGCIDHLLAAGCPHDWDLHHGNGVLARYCHQTGAEDAEDLAIQFFEATLAAGHPTAKSQSAALKDFRQWMKSCAEHEGTETALPFRCSTMVEGGPKEAKSCERCTGEACPAWPWIGTGAREQEFQSASGSREQKGENAADGSLLARRFWLGIQSVLLAGGEVRLSTVLAAAPEPDAIKGPSRVNDKADDLAEREFLAHLLQNPTEVGELLAGLELPAEAFNSRLKADWEPWAEALLTDPPCDRSTWIEHRNRLVDRANRTLAMALGRELLKDADDLACQPADAITEVVDGGAQLLKAADPELQPMREHVPGLLADLLRVDAPAIPLLHPGLARVFGGGLRPGRMVVIGGPPGCGKTTLSLQVADDAARAGFPVVFVSHEMTRGQLLANSLSRLSGIDGRTLMRKPPQPGSSDGALLQQAVATYQQEIAPRLFLLDGGPQHTPGKIRAMVGQVRRQLQLPDDHPCLVIVDYLQLSPSGLDGEGSMPEPLRVGAIATGLKQVARSTGASVWCLASVTKETFDQAASGDRLGAGVFADSARIQHTADTALALQSGLVHKAKRGRGNDGGDAHQGPRNLLEIAMSQQGLSQQWRDQLQGADRPLEHSGDTFARMDVIKNRGGASGQSVWSLYRRHLALFQPVLPCDLGNGPSPEHDGNDDDDF